MQALRNGAPPHTSEALAQEMGVSARTIHRDIDSLRGLGAVIDGAAGFGFTLIEDFPSIEKITSALNALGVSTREMMSIFQAMKRAGALQAELIIN